MESKSHTFRHQTIAFLKCFQIATQTAQLELLAEALPHSQRTTVSFMAKYTNIFTFYLVVTVSSKGKGNE